MSSQWQHLSQRLHIKTHNTMADVKTLLQREPKKYTETGCLQTHSTSSTVASIRELSQFPFSWSFISKCKYTKVKSPLKWIVPTQAFLKASSLWQVIPLLNKTVNIRKLLLLELSGQPHKTPYQKLPSLIRFLHKVQLMFPSNRKSYFFPMNTMVNAVCNIKTPPLDGNVIQQLKKNEFNCQKVKSKPKAHDSSFLKSSTIHNPFAPQVELWL